MWNEPKQESGFEDDPYFKLPCSDFNHKPPTHLVVPLGKRYRHVCPTCGAVSFLRSTGIRMSA